MKGTRKHRAPLGDVAEADFRSLCLQGGMFPTKTEYDRHAWDFLLEIPVGPGPIEAQRPPDLVLPKVTCLVQVKGTARTGSKVDSLTLTNCRHLAFDNRPVFFAVLRYADDRATEVWLVHFDQNMMRRTLQRLREAGGKSDLGLSRETVTLTLANAKRLPQVSGEALRAALVEAIGDPSRYEAEKAAWRRSVGYEEGRARLKFEYSFTPGSPEEEALLQFAVGARRDLPMSLREAVDTRFGIPAPIPGLQPGSGRIEFSTPPPAGEAFLTFSSPDGLKRASLTFEYRSSATFLPIRDPRLARARFVHRYCEVTLGGTDKGMSFTFSVPTSSTSVVLSEVAAVARFVHVVFGIGASELILEVQLNGGDVASFSCSVPTAPPSRDVRQVLDGALWLSELLISFGESVSIEVSGETYASQLGALRLARLLIGPSHQPASFRIDVGRDSAIGERACVPIMTLVEVRGCYYLLGGGLSGRTRLTASEDNPGLQTVSVDAGMAELLLKRRVVGSAESKQMLLETFYRELVARLERQHDTVIATESPFGAASPGG